MKKLLVFALIAVILCSTAVIPNFHVYAANDTTITFTIDEKPYTANATDTFEDWVNSEYNTDGYIIVDNKVFNSDSTRCVGDDYCHFIEYYHCVNPVYTFTKVDSNKRSFFTDEVSNIPSITIYIDDLAYTFDMCLDGSFGIYIEEWVTTRHNVDGFTVEEGPLVNADGSKYVVNERNELIASHRQVSKYNDGEHWHTVPFENPTDPPSENTEDADNIITVPAGNGKTNIILNTQATNFKVVVPIRIDISMDAEGQVSIPDSYVVSNESAWGPIVITGISAVKASGWEIKSFDTDFANMKANTKAIAMKINDAEVNADGSVVLSDSLKATINYNSSKSLSFEAKLPAQKSAWVENALAIVFTVDFDKV